METAPEKTILFIDDEETYIRTLALRLQLEARVLVATSAAQGFETMEREHVDIAVVDLFLGHVSGLEVLQRIREQHPDVSVICFSMMADPDTVASAYELGAVDYFSKNSEVVTLRLRRRIEALLAERALMERCANFWEALHSVQRRQGAIEAAAQPTLADAMEAFECYYLREAMRDAGGVRRTAAKRLDIPYSTLSMKLKQHGLADWDASEPAEAR